MKCTNKQQETAECEKRGCSGCFYNEKTTDEMIGKLGYTEAKIYKTADEMFEELGYEKGSGSNLGDGEKFIYYKGHYNDMRLYRKSRKISIHGSFTMQELQAINKKCEELKWI